MNRPTLPATIKLLNSSRRIKPHDRGWIVSCPCPGHKNGDEHPSLLVTEENGRCGIHCFTGHTPEEVLAAAGLDWADFFQDAPQASHKPREPVSTPTGAPFIASQFGEAKHWRQNTSTGKRMWWEPKGVNPRQFLYGDEGLWFTDPDTVAVLVVEGETPADAIRDLVLPMGYVVVATVCGASAIPDMAALKPLFGRMVTLWPDCDAPGKQHMEKIAAALHVQGATLMVVGWDGPDKGDAADAVKMGVDIGELLGGCAFPWTPPVKEQPVATRFF